MKPRISVLTLGVKNLQKAVAFYKDGLGWETEDIVGQDIENGAVAFFDLENGLKLALWPLQSIANDSGLGKAHPNAGPAFTLGHNVNSKQEVDQTFDQAVKAGARSVLKPEEKSWGGYGGVLSRY